MMNTSNTPDKHSSKYLPQLGLYLLMAILGAALSLSAIRLFPAQFLPQDVYQRVEKAAEVPAVVRKQIIAQNTEQHNFVVAAVNRVGSSVVRIDTERTVTIPRPSFFDDPFFHRFFGADNTNEMPWEYRLYGEGSGFIVDKDGFILTNAHVVSGADRVKMTLKDGRVFQGKVQGVDEALDLAIVKIDGQNLPVAPLGSSKDVQVGDWAIAVGNPFGLDNTVTVGIISTLKRSSSQVGIPDKRLDFMQTDAAINPGNSGGPLLNERGEVIGINTAIRAGASGIGFAIPIDTAKAVRDTLARGEKISHPYMGIRMQTLTPELAKEFNSSQIKPFKLPEIQGVLVIQVLPKSPAESAGLQPGDVIAEVNKQSVKDAEQLQNIVNNSSIGQSLQLKVWREKKVREFSVKPTELRDTYKQD
jgi:S1-C subfamily serine protease